MDYSPLFVRTVAVVALTALTASTGYAQDHDRRLRHAAVHASTPASGSTSGGTVRNLTINRLPSGAIDGFDRDDDIYLDGPIRYNSIRTFDPAPYADSGRQYPFGLDGIGGYGSDLGFSAGHDSLVYDRGF